MATWDIVNPTGTEDKSLGASRIRDGKSAQQTALQAEGIFPGTTPASPVYIATIPYGSEDQRPNSDTNFLGRWYFNTDTLTIQRDNGTAWDTLTIFRDLIPAGTAMVFFEASAPSGWTQVVTGIGDRLIRSVVGATGGTATAGTSIATPTAHNHTTQSANATHSHTLTQEALNTIDASPVAPINVLTSIPSPTSTADVAHYHNLVASIAFKPKYIDVIVATKN